MLGGAAELACDVRAGEMLYLPCGWFHEVTSYGEHAAINYWFHPPDTREFDRPYAARGYWDAEWRKLEQGARPRSRSVE